ncbi:lysylphosphatidylglycerol synthase transmembrane domain-containing protein [Algoriphagus halophytocola]|uniref:Flippase-like domain-containing protein n=1 Tax=Algoriphagus halophytocola TaxID=2991499 RepID=A0ABY6MLX0_9BACT|nr:lysylphosphatidylglycerol synthase transmembrane domain-containing protein [Algoriphagus sp. TR-M9]UZD24770.1 flippase-like domain-containing protein [Algoriphagus sp. TR-M5]WBL45161.1 lysylphosphatidylglycerol synthase transmembrane domain-containing protein [Algoriphagus sp. TR-M9]
MNSKRIKQIIQILLSFGIAVWIFWFLYRDIELETLIAQVKASNWAWIIGSLTISLFGYWIRGWRWTLLINSEEGEKVTPTRSYHAVMVGYLVNMLVPRAGEVARCGVLTRTNGISLGHLLGTVILERSIDLLFLIGTILLAFTVEQDLFLSLAGQLVDFSSLGESLLSNLPFVVTFAAIILLAIWMIFRRYKDHGLVNKIQHFFREILSGLKRIGQLNNPVGFWTSSTLLWIIYFLTMYTVSLGIQSTANLSSGEVLLVMVMGSIGMVAPVQGGIGTFHALVAFILIQLGISEVDGKIFAAIIHGTQVILVIVMGLISWIIMLKTPKWKQPETS